MVKTVVAVATAMATITTISSSITTTTSRTATVTTVKIKTRISSMGTTSRKTSTEETSLKSQTVQPQISSLTMQAGNLGLAADVSLCHRLRVVMVMVLDPVGKLVLSTLVKVYSNMSLKGWGKTLRSSCQGRTCLKRCRMSDTRTWIQGWLR